MASIGDVIVTDNDYCSVCGAVEVPVISFDIFGVYPTRSRLCADCLRRCLALLESEVEE